MSQTYGYTSYSSSGAADLVSSGDAAYTVSIGGGLGGGAVSYSSESYSVGGGSYGGASAGFGGSASAGFGGSSSAGYSSEAVLVGTSGSSSSQGVAGQVVSDLLSLGVGRGAAASAGGASYSASYSSGGASTQVLEASAFSEIEQAILRASNPIAINETETITVNGQNGIWANRAEVVNWRGVIPITQYLINEDANPEVIRKRTEQSLIYEQEIAIRYLRPPTPPPPGEILIRQEKNIVTPPAPPLVIRQQPPRPETPAPLVIREAPPKPPSAVGSKVVTISGKRLPPPPRKVIIERLAPLPSKPQSIFIERWLPYSQNKRRVIFQKSNEADPIIPKPRNVIVQWEAPAVTIKKEFKDLGVIRANPVEYVQRYGINLKAASELPSFVREIRPPAGVVLAAEYQAPSLFELEGDIEALRLIDLDQWGLSEYRSYLGGGFRTQQVTQVASSAASAFSVSAVQVVNAILTELFAAVDLDGNGRVTVSEAEKVLLKLNSRLGRSYGSADVAAFFRQLDTNRDGRVDLEEFKRGVLRDLNINA